MISVRLFSLFLNPRATANESEKAAYPREQQDLTMLSLVCKDRGAGYSTRLPLMSLSCPHLQSYIICKSAKSRNPRHANNESSEVCGHLLPVTYLI